MPIDGARTPTNNLSMPPWRSRSRSSMLSAPASMPPTTLAAFTAAFGDLTLTCSASRSCRPADSANNMAGTSPAADTRFGSSNTGRIV